MRIPRIGKLHSGVKTEKGYPKAVDYFVVKEDQSTPAWAADAFHEVYGDQPHELDIMFPTDDISQWADANYHYYSQSWANTCSGDGDRARAKWDLANDGPRPEGVPSGTWANRKTDTWAFREIPCLAEDCPQQQGERPNCKAVMNLLFLLPSVKGVGAWQIDTSSIHSIRNIRDNVALIKATTGRIRGLELKLRLEPKQVSPPGIKTKTVWVLNIALPQMRLGDLLQMAANLPEHGLLLPPKVSEEEVPEDLYPDAIDVDAETGEIHEPPLRDDLKTAGELLTEAWKEMRISSGTVFRILEVAHAEEITDYAAAWAKLKAWEVEQNAKERTGNLL